MSTQSRHRCSDLVDLLSAYADHEATPAEMTLVEAHARTCAACAARLQRYVRLAPRVESDVRALLSRGEAASREAKPMRFHTWLRAGSSLPGLVSRLATLAMLVAVGLGVAFVLLRSAPAVQSPVDTASQASTGTAPEPVHPSGGPVLVVSIDGLVDPAVAAYVHRAVGVAEERQAAGLVVVLNASGGLDASMHQVADDLTSSSVPTLAYVGPGATNAANAALAQASDVRAAASSAPNLDTVLRSVDGREAPTPSGPVVLNLASSPVQTLDMEPLEAAAHRLMDPTTTYLLLVLGLYAVFVEVAHPGALLPGATGLVCLALASVGLTALPTNWLGLGVLVVAVGLMGLELKAATHGGLVVAGVASLVVGSVLLYAAPGTVSPVDADVAVAPAVWVCAAIAGLVLGLLLARIAARIHRLPPLLSLEQLIGAAGVARSGLAPEGVVQVHGQLWSARLRGGQLESGQPIRVIARHGLVLEVESTAPGGAATRKGAFR